MFEYDTVFGLFKVQICTRDMNANFGRCPLTFGPNTFLFVQEKNKQKYIYFILGKEVLLN